jgi:hypothetical protein
MRGQSRVTKLLTGTLPIAIQQKLRSQLLKMGGLCLLAILTLLPIYNIFHILATTGDNNLSNDYAMFLPLIDKILSGNYAWGYYFQDTFFVSHFQPLPILVYLINAKITGWNIYYELFFIAILAILRLFLTYQALTCLYSKGLRYLMWPILALLIFSSSQISGYEFGASAVPLGLTAFGFTLSIWGLVKFYPQPVALVFMVAGGLIASWTGALGVIAWPIFLAGMILLGYKKLAHYLTWLVSALLINFPYIYFLIINRQPGVNAYLQSLFDFRLIVNLLGRPFANGIGSTTAFLPLGEAAGYLGLAFGVLGLALIVVFRRRLLVTATPALMFMAFGLLSAWQTSIFRVLIAPWYTNTVMPYWIGLAGLAYLLAAAYSDRLDAPEPAASKFNRHVLWVYPTLVLIVFALFYLATNLTYRDKSFYLISRSPASAACIRNYQWAPTYCERRVFQWTVNRVYLADFSWPLQRHQLSVFTPHQRWTMQGDVILGKVYSPEAPNTLGVDWYDGLPGTQASYTDYRHLNLLVSPSHSAAWTVTLPENLASAEFVSSIGIGRGSQPGEPMTFEVFVSLQGQSEQLVFSRVMDASDSGWSKFNFSLLPFQEEEITLRLAVSGKIGALETMYRFPYIDLTIQPEDLLTQPPTVRPINTELSPDAPQTQPSDYIFSLDGAQTNGMVLLGGHTSTWVAQIDPNFYLPLDHPLDLQDYGWVSFRLAASPDIPSRAAEVFLYMEGQAQPAELLIPLLADGGLHTYTYPLRLVDISGRLVALRLDPVMLPSSKGDNTVTIQDLRLIRAP